MKKKRVRRPSSSTGKRSTSTSSYQSFIILALGVLVIIIVGKVIISSLQNNNILGTATYLAKGDDSDGDSSGSSGSGSSGGSSSDDDNRSEDKREEVRVESRGGETRIELRQKTDGDKARIKQQIRTENGRIKFELKDGETKIKIETKTGQPQGEFTIENPATPSSQIAEIEDAEEKFKLKIRTSGGRFELRVKGTSALTNFPLLFNPETNELSVTTPVGIVLVKTLPQVAVQNVLASNIMDRVLGQDVAEPDEAEEEEEEEEAEEEDIEEVETPEVKVEGFVETLTASQITVSGVTFTINNATKFEGAVAVGSGVEVKGNPQNGALVARKVELENEVEPRIKIQGVVDSVTDDAIVVSGITFSRSSATRIEGNLAPGQQVEIKGTPATGGALLANKIETELSGEGMVLTQEQGVTVFKVKGQKDASFLNLIPVTFPIEATVSVETGRILSVSRPFLFNIFGFLFRT